MRCVAASSKTPWVTADARGIPSIKSGSFCAPHTRRLTPRQKERLREAFVADEAHISVEVAYLLTQQVREVFHQDTPAQGQRLAAHLIESLPRCPVPEIARLGANPTQVEGRTRRLLRYRRSQQRANRSHQRNHRAGQTNRQRLPQPHQLQTPNAPHRRRPRRLRPHSTLKSQYSINLLPLPKKEHCSQHQANTPPTGPSITTHNARIRTLVAIYYENLLLERNSNVFSATHRSLF